MEGENLIENRGFLAAPLTFFVVVVFQMLSKYLDQLKKVIKKVETFGRFHINPFKNFPFI